MERPNTVAGLSAKRKEIKDKIRGLIRDIRSIDAAIMLFDPDVPTRKRRIPYGLRYRFISNYLREATGPVTVAEVSGAWIRDQGLILDCHGRNEIRRRVRNTFGRLNAAGVIFAVSTITDRKGWLLSKQSLGAIDFASIKP